MSKHRTYRFARFNPGGVRYYRKVFTRERLEPLPGEEMDVWPPLGAGQKLGFAEGAGAASAMAAYGVLHGTAGTAFGAHILGTGIGIAGGAGAVGALAPAAAIGAGAWAAFKAAPHVKRGAKSLGRDFATGWRESRQRRRSGQGCPDMTAATSSDESERSET